MSWLISSRVSKQRAFVGRGSVAHVCCRIHDRQPTPSLVVTFISARMAGRIGREKTIGPNSYARSMPHAKGKEPQMVGLKPWANRPSGISTS